LLSRAQKTFAKPPVIAEIASVLVRLDHVASLIVNPDHGVL